MREPGGAGCLGEERRGRERFGALNGFDGRRDSAGQLAAFSKMDNTQHASVDIAIGKAVTANNFKRPTKALQDAIAQGGANLRLLAVKGATPLEGGVPIIVDGKIIGAIGASGVMANQDAEVAMAGAAAAK